MNKYQIDNNKVVLSEWFGICNVEIKPLIVTVRIGVILQKEMILVCANFVIHAIKISTPKS